MGFFFPHCGSKVCSRFIFGPGCDWVWCPLVYWRTCVKSGLTQAEVSEWWWCVMQVHQDMKEDKCCVLHILNSFINKTFRPGYQSQDKVKTKAASQLPGFGSMFSHHQLESILFKSGTFTKFFFFFFCPSVKSELICELVNFFLIQGQYVWCYLRKLHGKVFYLKKILFNIFPFSQYHHLPSVICLSVPALYKGEKVVLFICHIRNTNISQLILFNWDQLNPQLSCHYSN